MAEIVDVCELPRRPSDLIGMPDAGYSEEACLDFDRECVRVTRRLRRIDAATEPVQVKALPKPRKGMVWSTGPKYSDEQRYAAYGVEPGDPDEVREAIDERASAAAFRPEDFADLDWDDWTDPDGEGG